MNQSPNRCPPLPPRVAIAIVGGGMVGLALAAILAARSPQLSLALVEAMPLPAGAPGDRGQLPPSFDARSTALAESTRRIFEQVALWSPLAPSLCPISAIHVSDRGHPGATRLTAAESGLPGLGYVVENRLLGRALLAAVQARANVSVHAPARVERLTPVAGGMVLEVDGHQCHAELVVVADGGSSSLLPGLGIHTTSHDYRQTALIANLALAEPHGGIAYERFTDEGPMALLPLTDVEGERRAALVWTLTPERAEIFRRAPQHQVLDELHARFGFRAGRIVRCGECFSYPLKLLVADEQVRSGLAVVGNAAHFLHPVAGQGFNLALRDVARLAEVVLDGIAAGESPGNLALLERYLATQNTDQRNTIAFSHTLPTLFGRRSAPGVALRNAGLIALDLLSPARRSFAGFGAGLASPGVHLHD